MSTYVHDKTCTQIFRASVLIIAKYRKPPKCPSMDDYIDKQFVVYPCIRIH